ncbi:MAG: helix-turn-helix domain-containing protein, partial [Chloroflexia bacterium]|nr:helix-turn-helix domain-containing protein [Chloroflexia bacterium]
MRAYSVDLRERVVAAVAAGATHAEAAARFAVGVATVGRWVRRWREAGGEVLLDREDDLLVLDVRDLPPLAAG